MAITLVDSSVVGGAERHRSSLPVWMRMRIVSVEACPLIHDAARGKMSSHRTSSVTSEDGETPVPESLYAIKRSYYCIGLLSACIVPLLAVFIAEHFSVTDSASYSQGLDHELLATLIRAEIQTTFKREMKELEQRIRLLEEDSLFRGRKDDINVRLVKSGQPVSYPAVTVLPEGERKRILVTGGAGFVGSHLVDRLMRDGHEVTVVDNFFTGRKKNIEHWIGHDNFDLVNHDIVNPLMIEVDEIYHLASPASPVKYMYNPIKTIKTNTLGTLNMLGLAKRVKGRILLSSTSEVYGDPEVHPQVEEYWGHVNPIGPRACYDEGKRVAETMAYAYAKQENVEVRVARIFNTYGPKMHMYDGRVVSNFIIQALQNQTLTVFAPGNQSRSFMYISDLVEGMILLMQSNYSDPVNLGNPDEYTILNFAKNIINSVGATTSTIELLPATQDDPRRRRPSIKRAKNVLGWEPKVSLKEGIQKTVEYFRIELQQQKLTYNNT